MKLELNHEGAGCRLELDGLIDISCAAELKALLLQALETGQDICVSLAAATDLDLTAVQLLWAAAREAKQRGLAFAVTDPPEPICRSLESAGLLPAALFIGAAKG